MEIDFEKLEKEPRMLLEVELKPTQGTRFQPTGFPDIGAATYQTDDGQMLLVESAQSMANRMEAVCWDDANNTVVKPLEGIPYINVKDENGSFLTNSLLEAHRINSAYILESVDDAFLKQLRKDLEFPETGTKVGRVDMKLFAKILLKYDINSLIHGVFLENLAGRLRIPRALSAFVEASDVRVAQSGGAKIDNVDPTGPAKDGFGNIPFQRDEYTGKLKAYFSLDLAQIRGYALTNKDAEKLLITLALYKIQKVLGEGLKFRTACDLETVGDLIVKKPDKFTVPSLSELGTELKKLIVKCKNEFAKPEVTEVTYKSKPRKGTEKPVGIDGSAE